MKIEINRNEIFIILKISLDSKPGGNRIMAKVIALLMTCILV